MVGDSGPGWRSWMVVIFAVVSGVGRAEAEGCTNPFLTRMLVRRPATAAITEFNMFVRCVGYYVCDRVIGHITTFYNERNDKVWLH